jgi:hypothetical protein
MFLLRRSKNKDCFLFFNATFSNISGISWRPVLVVEEAECPERTTDNGQATSKLLSKSKENFFVLRAWVAQ